MSRPKPAQTVTPTHFHNPATGDPHAMLGLPTRKVLKGVECAQRRPVWQDVTIGKIRKR